MLREPTTTASLQEMPITGRQHPAGGQRPADSLAHPHATAPAAPPLPEASSTPGPGADPQRTPGYHALFSTYQRIHHLNHLQAVAYWDQATQMPPAGAQARAAALAEAAAITHRMRTDPAMHDHMVRAEQEPLAPLQRANLREIARDWRAANALPEDLVQRSELAAARCEHAWRTQRPANDWAGFAPNLREVVANAREQARLLSYLTDMRPYDTLLDRFEPGMTCERLDTLFADMRQWLPGLVHQVRARQQGRTVLQPQGPFDVAAQRQLCLRVAAVLGFDFRAGRIDTSTHPFTGGMPEDVRMTTRFDPADVFGGLLSAVHECGHGRYEQGLPRAWLGQPLGLARSMAIHESQSLGFEMQLMRHPGLLRRLAPWLAQAFGDQPAFAPDNLQRLLTQVQPGLIRVDADELTYPAHVMLRYQIERALIECEIEVDDIPALWDHGMRELLGVDSRGNHRDGAMQDMHWPEGLFGYFPCYTLGALYAAHWFAAMRRAMPDLDARIAEGDLSGLMGWLSTHIWQQGCRWPTDELCERASGEALNPAHFRQHLERRYLDG